MDKKVKKKVVAGVEARPGHLKRGSQEKDGLERNSRPSLCNRLPAWERRGRRQWKPGYWDKAEKTGSKKQSLSRDAAGRGRRQRKERGEKEKNHFHLKGPIRRPLKKKRQQDSGRAREKGRDPQGKKKKR